MKSRILTLFLILAVVILMNPDTKVGSTYCTETVSTYSVTMENTFSKSEIDEPDVPDDPDEPDDDDKDDDKDKDKDKSIDSDKDKKDTDKDSDTEKEKSKNTKTGDESDIRMWTGLMLISLLGLALMLWLSRRENEKRDIE